MLGAGLTFDLDDVTTIGQGATGVTAQDGIELGYDAVGTVDNCTIADIAYTGASWTASGFLAYNGASFVANNVDVDNCQTSVYIQDSSGSYDGADITNPLGDAMYAYSTGAKADGAKPLTAQPFEPFTKRADKSPDRRLGRRLHRHRRRRDRQLGRHGIRQRPDRLHRHELRREPLGLGRRALRLRRRQFRRRGPRQQHLRQRQLRPVPNAAETAAASCNWWGERLRPGGDQPDERGHRRRRRGCRRLLAVAGRLGTGRQLFHVRRGQRRRPFRPSEISACNPCVTVPIEFSRTDNSPLRGVSITFQLSSELELCAGTSSVTLATGMGSLYDGFTNTQLFVIDNGSGSYTADATLLGTPCGVTVGGTVLDVDVTAASGVITDTTGTITVTSVTVRNCANAPLPGTPGAPGTVTINNGAPDVVTGLAALQVKTGNLTNGRTKINLTWTDPGDMDLVSIEIYRKGFGDYPEYDDGAGAVPTAPATPAAALLDGWTLVAASTREMKPKPDEPATRDFWYYVAFAS